MALPHRRVLATSRRVLATSLAILLLAPLDAVASVDAPCDGAPVAAGAEAPAEGDATAIDYGVIAALVAVVIITGLTALGSSLNTKFTSVSSTVNSTGCGGCTPCGSPGGGDTTASAEHAPGGQTRSAVQVDGVFAEGGSVHGVTSATSDFGNFRFGFTEAASVLNSRCAAEANVGLDHELEWTLSLLAEMPPTGPPGEMARLRMEFDFEHLAWGIGGPVPSQDGVFEIEGPGGATWGWSMEKNTATGKLEITSTNGPALGDFALGSGTGPLTIQGIEFQPQEVLVGVGDGPSFEFDIPYGVPTDVTFRIRRLSHTGVPGPPHVPALPVAAAFALGLALIPVGWVASRRVGRGHARA
jgi:pilus assembly protein Flp/PilA